MNKFIAHKNSWIYESPNSGKTIYRRPYKKVGPKFLILWKNIPGTICMN
jgi:hypothetical protein